MSSSYRAWYGDQSCVAHPEGETDGRTFSVLLDKDPGFGSMVYTRVGRSELVLGEALPPPAPPEERISVGVPSEQQWRLSSELGTQRDRGRVAVS